MNENLMKYLEYILPTRHRNLDQDMVTAVGLFNALYGDKMSKLLDAMDIPLLRGRLLQKNKADAIVQITEHIKEKRPAEVCVNSGKLDIKKIVLPNMKKTKAKGFDNDSSITYVVTSALIAFERILVTVRLLPHDAQFEYNCANILATLQSVSQLDKFVIAWEKRQPHSKVAHASASKKNGVKIRTQKMLRAHGVRYTDNNPETISGARRWYFEKFGAEFPYTDKKLGEYIESL